MVGVLSLVLCSIVTICPFASTLTLSLHNVTFPSSISPYKEEPPDTHCTKNSAWFLTPFHSIASYDYMCQAALTNAVRDLTLFGMDIEYELLSRDAVAQTTKLKIRLPRRYVACKYRKVTRHDAA